MIIIRYCITMIVLITYSHALQSAAKNSANKYAMPPSLAKQEDRAITQAVLAVQSLGKAGMMQSILDIFNQHNDADTEVIIYSADTLKPSIPITLSMNDLATTPLSTKKRSINDEDDMDDDDDWYYYDESALHP